MDQLRLHIPKLSPLVALARVIAPVDPTANDTRPFFADLYRKHHFNVDELAQCAATHQTVILAMLRAKPVYRFQAEKVLKALSNLVNAVYNLTTVYVPLIQEPKR